MSIKAGKSQVGAPIWDYRLRGQLLFTDQGSLTLPYSLHTIVGIVIIGTGVSRPNALTAVPHEPVCTQSCQRGRSILSM
jgi:hypothetical protein